MYDGFLKVYDVFKKHEVENPLIETLHLFNILGNYIHYCEERQTV